MSNKKSTPISKATTTRKILRAFSVLKDVTDIELADFLGLPRTTMYRFRDKEEEKK